jgi:Ca-activated chloride channel family protein
MRTVIAASFIGFAVPAQACEVALMLAVDVSGSVDSKEYRVQMDGLASALVDRSVMGALIEGKVQLALMQWTGSGRNRVVINWKEMASEVDVVTFADQVVAEPRLWRNFSTAIGEAMALSLAYFAQVPDCKRHVVDISGDGRSNEGRLPRDLWEELAEAEVTVNALAIEQSVPKLTEYFENEVIMGPGSFAVTANTFEDYPEQMVRKLYRELTKVIASVETD